MPDPIDNVTPVAPTPAAVSTSSFGAAKDAFSRYANLAPQVEAAIFGSQQQISAAGQQEQIALRGTAEQQGKSAVAAGEQQIYGDDLHRKILSAIGLDVNDPESALNHERQIEASSRQEREATRHRIAELQGVSFFQNPFAFLMAQPELTKLVPRHNELVDIESEASQQIAQMQTRAQALITATPARSADLVRAKAQADANALSQAAEVQAQEVSAKNAAGNAKALLDALTVKHNTFAGILSLTQTEESMKMRQLQFEALNDQRAITNEQRAERLKMQQDSKNQETALVTGINLYRRAISGNTAAEYTSEDMKRMPADQRGAWFEVIQRGNYGNSYAESIPFIDRFGNVAAAAESGNAAMMQQVRMIKQKAEAAVPAIINREKLKNPMAQITPRMALEMAYNEQFAADQSVAQKGADKRAITASSPYAIDFDSAAAVAKAKPEGLISKVLLNAKNRNPYQPLNGNLTVPGFLADVEAQVVSGSVDPKTAAEQTAQFIALSASTGWDSGGLKYIGLPQLTDYTISTGPAGKSTVDLMNPTRLENYFTSQITKKRRADTTILNNRPFTVN